MSLGLISPVVHRWENFTECFPVFCKEEGDRAQGVFNTLSRHMESSLVVRFYLPTIFLAYASSQEATDKFFDEANIKQAIDDLHAAVVDAKLRKQRNEVRTDVWREDLHPRAATRARTVPLLERERERLQVELREVFSLTSFIFTRSCPFQLEDENLKLQEEIESNVRQFNENEKGAENLLDVLDQVGMSL